MFATIMMTFNLTWRW